MVLAAPAQPPLRGEVVHIASGDTLSVRVDGVRLRLRLEGIAAPRPGAPLGNAARKALGNLAFGRTASVHARGDAGGHPAPARVYAQGLDLSAEMLRRGLARLAPEGVPDRLLAAAEAQARAAGRGLWRAPHAPHRPPGESARR